VTPPQKLEPLRAALDTEIFVREQYDFVRSYRLKRLIERVAEGHLELFITDVTEREVRAGIKRRVTEAIALLQNKKATRILQNTTLFTSLVSIDVAKTIAELEAQFDHFCTVASIEKGRPSQGTKLRSTNSQMQSQSLRSNSGQAAGI
jgi:hypothetical protein